MQFKAIFKIIRLKNCLFTFICVFFSAVYAGTNPLNPEIILISLAAMLIAASGYVINDIFDIEIDKINKPNRPLPTGAITVKQARLLSIALAGLGLVLSLFGSNIWLLIIAGFNAILLFYYAILLKKICLIGNLAVAWSAASCFLFGALLGPNLKIIIPIFVFAFIYTILREWVKTIEDYEGDKSEQAMTISVILGKKKTARLSIMPAIMIMLAIFIFYYLKMINGFLFCTLNILVSIPLIFFMIVLLKSQHKTICGKIHKWMKADMLFLMLSFFSDYLLRIWS